MPQLDTTFRFNDFWRKHPTPYYPGTVVVNFEKNDNTDNGLYVAIETPHVTLHSIQQGEDQDFYSRLRANSEANRLFGTGNTLAVDKANEISNAQIKRWENGCALAGFIITLKEEEGNQLKTSQMSSGKANAGRIGYVVLGYGGQYIQDTAQSAIILDPNAWKQGYAKAALWSVSNSYAHRLKNEKNEKGEALFIGKNNQPLIGIEASARTDNPHSIDMLLNTGADIQCIQEAKTPVNAAELNSIDHFPKPINSRFVFFQPAEHFSEEKPKLSMQALLPNAARLVATL